MNIQIHTNKKSPIPSGSDQKIPWKAIIVTAIVTMSSCLVLLYFTGFLSIPTNNASLSSTSSSTPPVNAPHGDASHDPASEDENRLWTCGMHPWVITEEPGLCPICNMDLIPKQKNAKKGSENDSKTPEERTIVYWKAPMDPTEVYDRPGKTKMGMDRVPVYEDELVSGVDVSINPLTQQNMGLRVAPVEEGRLENTIRTYGHITIDETRIAQVSPKVSGWIETLHVNFTGVGVERGEPLLEIYSPELLSAQEEYLSLFQSIKPRDTAGADHKGADGAGFRNKRFLDSARRRLIYFDVAKEEIKAIEQSGQTRKTLTIRSPFKGVVTFKNALEGGYVKAGTNLYTIADLSRVWVDAHIYEYELDQVKVGQKATMTLPYLPGKTYTGTVTFIYPYLQQKTRDVIIRLEFANPRMELKPEMFGDVEIRTRISEKGIQIPSEAVIRSGERNVVFVSRGNGQFTPREVTLGSPLKGGKIQILTGLTPEEQVVTSGQFMLDSESKLQEVVQKMMERANPAKGTTEIDKKSGTADTMDFFDDMDMEIDQSDHVSGENSRNETDNFFKDME